MRWLYTLLCLCPVALFGATGDVLGGYISRSGFILYLGFEGLTTNSGSWNLGSAPDSPKITLTVNTVGYDQTGATCAVARTIYATTNIHAPYNSSYIVINSVTNGPFWNGETLTQAVTGIYTTNILDSPCSPLYTFTSNDTSTCTASDIWWGLSSGASAKPVTVPTSLNEGGVGDGALFPYWGMCKIRDF